MGATKFGGRPDLPGDAVWPVRPPHRNAEDSGYLTRRAREARPLTFIDQINLEDVRKAGGCGLVLPEQGLLSFFYDTEV